MPKTESERIAHAEYMRGYRKTVLQRSIRTAYKQGVQDMRITVIRMFRNQIADRELNGLAAAKIVEALRVD